MSAEAGSESQLGLRACRELAAALAAHPGGIEQFVRKLDRQRVPYLSYSKVACVEFCPHRYRLEYVQVVKLWPEPAYFVKGRAFHKAAARYYEDIGRGRTTRSHTFERLARRSGNDEADRQHLCNAIHLLRENVMDGWKVVAVEQPFVLSLGRGMPPCIGVVDLVLRKDGVYAVIDHKTGKSFGNTDAMQLALYRKYVQRRHRAKECIAYFDQYRWVNNLDRIRKPAFRRTKARLTDSSWDVAVRRFRRAEKEIERVEAGRLGRTRGMCYMCRYRDVCDESTGSSYRW